MSLYNRRKNPRAKVAVVVNRARAGTLLSAALEDSLEGLPLLPVRVAERQGFQQLLLSGWSALDPRAVQEALQFRDAVMVLT